MEAGLPSAFDVVVVGTGLTESIVSAAASRNGHTLLHLDPREFYGSCSATLNFDSWTAQEFAISPPTISEVEVSSNGDQLEWKNCCRNVEQVWYESSDGVKKEFEGNKRRFNIDVFPQIILAREEIIELLIKSDVSRYLEFLRVGKLFTKLPNEDTIVSIPLSRSDIFTSKSVSLGEKRCLVKFIEAVMQQNQSTDDLENENSNETLETLPDIADSSTFDELANICKLTPKVKHLIRSVVENVEDKFSSEESFQTGFVSRCRKYLQSIGRFGNQTPYLWPLYGVSEICQGFCRLSAVYGSIFILKRFVNSIEETGEGTLKITSENDQFEAKHLVIGPEFKYLHSSASSPSDNAINEKPKVVGRGVIVTKGNNLKAETESTTNKGDGICFYKIGNIQIVELSNSSQAVPKNYHLLQITFAVDEEYPGSLSASPREYIESQLQSFVNFEMVMSSSCENDELGNGSNDIRPQAIYGSYFWIDLWNGQESSPTSRIHNCAVDSTDLTSRVSRAANIFRSMFPGEEFLPKPPPPEHDENDTPEIDIDNLPNHFDIPPKPCDDDPLQQPSVPAE